jgi:hypothetical protein
LVEARESYKLSLRKEQIESSIMNKRLKLMAKGINQSFEINPDTLNIDHTMSVDPVISK